LRPNDQYLAVRNLQHVAKLRGHVGEIWSAAISPDGSTLVSGGADGTTKLWTAVSKPDESSIPGVFAGCIQGNTVACVQLHNMSLVLWDLAANTQSSYVWAEPPVFSVGAVVREGSVGFVGHTNGNVESWRFPGGDKGASWRAHDAGVTAIAHSQRANRLATASGGEVKLWDIGAQRLLNQFRVARPILTRLAFSPDSRILAGCGESSDIWLWDLETGGVLLHLDHDSPSPTPVILNWIDFSPDGSLFITTSRHNDAMLWELPSGKRRAVLQGHVQGVWNAAFSPDSKTLATAGEDAKVKLWNVATAQELTTLRLPGLAYFVQFSANCQALAIATYNTNGPLVQLLRAPSLQDIDASDRKGKAR